MFGKFSLQTLKDRFAMQKALPICSLRYELFIPCLIFGLLLTTQPAGSELIDNDNLSVKFTWTAATGNPEFYNVYVSNNSAEFVLVGTTPTTSYMLTGKNQHTYKIKVQAADSKGNVGPMSDESAPVTIMLPDLNMGDINADDIINAYDVSLVLQHVVGLTTLTQEQQKAADVSGNNTVTAYDAVLILQHTVGLITQFPGSGVAVASKTTESFKVSLPDIAAKPSEKITVPINIEDLTGIIAGEMTLSYDSDILRIVDVATTPLTKGCSLEYKVSDGNVKIAFAGDVEESGDAVFLNVFFEVLPYVTKETSVLRLSVATLNEDIFSVTKIDGLIKLLPGKNALLPNYPNPFNPETWMPFKLSKDARVAIKIYNARGELVKNFDLGQIQAGSYLNKERAVHWDGRNALGERAASGIYFYSLEASGFQKTRKMIILK